MMGRRKHTEEDFWTKMSRPSIGCWDWGLSLSPSGYGKATWHNKSWRAHRLAYFLSHGDIPKIVMHTCDNRKCCNPDHLIAGSHEENMQDMATKGRAFKPKGVKHSQNKYSEDMILEIRDKFEKDIPQAVLAREYSLHSGYTSQIVRRKRWTHI